MRTTGSTTLSASSSHSTVGLAPEPWSVVTVLTTAHKLYGGLGGILKTVDPGITLWGTGLVIVVSQSKDERWRHDGIKDRTSAACTTHGRRVVGRVGSLLREDQESHVSALSPCPPPAPPPPRTIMRVFAGRVCGCV